MATYYVSKDGDDDANDGLSVASAWSKIRTAWLRASTDDTIYVLSGTYSDSIPFNANRSGTMVSAYPGLNKNDVVLEASGTTQAVYFHRYNRLKGITVRRGAATSYIIHIEDGCEIEDCVFSGSSGREGTSHIMEIKGIYNKGVNPPALVKRCVFIGDATSSLKNGHAITTTSAGQTNFRIESSVFYDISYMGIHSYEMTTDSSTYPLNSEVHNCTFYNVGHNGGSEYTNPIVYAGKIFNCIATYSNASKGIWAGRSFDGSGTHAYNMVWDIGRKTSGGPTWHYSSSTGNGVADGEPRQTQKGPGDLDGSDISSDTSATTASIFNDPDRRFEPSIGYMAFSPPDDSGYTLGRGRWSTELGTAAHGEVTGTIDRLDIRKYPFDSDAIPCGAFAWWKYLDTGSCPEYLPDHTINVANCVTKEHKRNVDQVPLSRTVRGPASLRLRTTAYQVNANTTRHTTGKNDKIAPPWQS